jgi:thymidylate synthase (FAD)
MDNILGEVKPILDHGHVVVLDYMGTDQCIVDAARTSYQQGTKKISTDKQLINYLLSHHHMTPFEMCEIKMHVRMPIFVARQWIRHRTASVNEMSARYSILPALFYVPENAQCAVQSTTNRQGRGDVLPLEEAQEVRANIMEQSAVSYRLYEKLLGMKIKDGKEVLIEGGHDLARELARMVLPTNFYTEWVWKVDLRNLLGFLLLRADSHAQYEIRVYAEHILENILQHWLPTTYAAFKRHQKNAVNFDEDQMKVIHEWIYTMQDAACQPADDWWKVAAKEYGLSARQIAHIRSSLKI